MQRHNAAADAIGALHCDNISLQLLYLELNNQSYTMEVLLSQYIHCVVYESVEEINFQHHLTEG